MRSHGMNDKGHHEAKSTILRMLFVLRVNFRPSECFSRFDRVRGACTARHAAVHDPRRTDWEDAGAD